MTINFRKIIIGILKYLQKYYKITWLRRTLFLQFICLYMSFSTYSVVKFISLVVTFKVFLERKIGVQQHF